MEFLKGLVSGESGALAQILVIIGIVNGSMAGLSLIIASFKDKTETKIDNQVYSVLTSILHYASVVVDFLSANTKHVSKEGQAKASEGQPK